MYLALFQNALFLKLLERGVFFSPFRFFSLIFFGGGAKIFIGCKIKHERLKERMQ